MHAVIRGLICVLMLLLVVARAAIAQDLLTVSGVVTTRADGMPVPGATVSVVGADASATTCSRTGTATVNSFNGIQTFPRHSPFGMNGRAIYARIGRRF